jgi:pimeloyl-ACP methyl ester carboxylesterase
LGVLDRELDAAVRAELPDVDRDWGDSRAERERWLAGFVNYWSGAGAWDQLRPEARAEFTRVAWDLHQGVGELLRSGTPLAAFSEIRCPLTLVNGELSPLAARRITALLAATVRGSRLVALKKVGHLAPLTHPGIVNAALLGSLRGVTAEIGG